jgi:hypothetical protein
MKKFIAGLALAITLALGASFATVEPAQADRGGRVAAGVAAGIIGLGILGAYAHARERDRGPVYYRPACYDGPRECFYKPGGCYITRYGDEVCRRGQEVCQRRRICD